MALVGVYLAHFFITFPSPFRYATLSGTDAFRAPVLWCRQRDDFRFHAVRLAWQTRCEVSRAFIPVILRVHDLPYLLSDGKIDLYALSSYLTTPSSHPFSPESSASPPSCESLTDVRSVPSSRGTPWIQTDKEDGWAWCIEVRTLPSL